MMKNFKKFTAFVLALCMMFSLSISAFAAEEHDHHEHTVYACFANQEGKDEAQWQTRKTSARKSTQRSICVCGRSRNDPAGHSANS